MGKAFVESDDRQLKLHEVMERLCMDDDDNRDDSDHDDDQHHPVISLLPNLDDMVRKIDEILKCAGGSVKDATSLKQVEHCFKSCDKKSTEDGEYKEFVLVEKFVLEEQNRRRSERTNARNLTANEESRLAAEVAQLKGLRLKLKKNNSDEELRWKIADAERSYLNRKMVFAKASQVAASECRQQFARVRIFLEQLHQSRQELLRHQHRRAQKYQSLIHILCGTEARVVSLDVQISERLYQKKKADLNEKHMAQTLDEAMYLESMMDVLDSVQIFKEGAARELFDLHVKHIKAARDSNDRRAQELELFSAAGTLEMAKLVAQYYELEVLDMDREVEVQENVARTERNKDSAAFGHKTMSISQVYDAVLWSVAINDLGLGTSSGSTVYSSDCEDDLQAYDNDEDDELGSTARVEDMGWKIKSTLLDCPDTASDTEEDEEALHRRLTPPGRIHAKQLARQLRVKEKDLVKKHEEEMKQERRGFRHAVQALKKTHQNSLDKLLEKSLIQRQNIREEIIHRMDDLIKRQVETTEQLRKKDMQLMEEALRAEDQRVADEARNFLKAQELVSAQVLHEVRNALSSIVAMSEITSSWKNDVTLSPKEIVVSIDDMLGQTEEVVNYALKLLNNFLDVSKINSGAFTSTKKPFDLNEVVAGATRMQIAKAKRSKLSFVPSSQPCVAISDCDIVERIVATLISNAVKFTSAGAVQPFIWPLEAIQDMLSIANSTTSQQPEDRISKRGLSDSDPETESGSEWSGSGDESLNIQNSKVKMVAVGVADTGPGLSEEALERAQFVIETFNSGTSFHGAQNTGFGLYHAHLQAKALGTKLQLTTLEKCRSLLNQEMVDAMIQQQQMQQHTKHSKGTDAITTEIEDDPSFGLDSQGEPRPTQVGRPPGHGTVIYLTIPVYEDGVAALIALLLKKNSSIHGSLSKDEIDPGARLVIHKQPFPGASSDGRFHILVADDVLMIRKGTVNTISNLWSTGFFSCPVVVSTACTAEDVLRAASSQPFDLIICDHHFRNDASKLKSICPDADPTTRASKSRPFVSFDDSVISLEDRRKSASAFFKDERFTIEEGDGNLCGLEALKRLTQAPNPPFPTPVLMLVSGHKIDEQLDLDIIVAQKPLKQADFVQHFKSIQRFVRRDPPP